MLRHRLLFRLCVTVVEDDTNHKDEIREYSPRLIFTNAVNDETSIGKSDA